MIISLTTAALLALSSDEPRQFDGVAYICEAFDRHRAVGIGESHALVEQYAFFERLIRSDCFLDQVDAIAIEAGNSRYQHRLDAYLRGEDVPEARLVEVWRNTSQSPVAAWDRDMYRDLIDLVRQINLEQGRSIRVLAADTPVEWSQIETREDLANLPSRNIHYASVVKREALDRGDRVLMIAGGAHFSNRNQPDPLTRSAPINLILSEDFPGEIYFVQILASLGRDTDEYSHRFDGWEAGKIAEIRGSWLGRLRGPTQPGPPGEAGPADSVMRQDLYDAVLFVGAFDTLTFASADPAIYTDEYWAELNRRSLIRFNHPLVDDSRQRGSPRPEAWR